MNDFEAKNGDTVLLILVNRAAILGSFSRRDDKGVYLKSILGVNLEQDQQDPRKINISFSPYLPPIATYNPDAELLIKDCVIMHEFDPPPQIAATYAQATGKIQIASALPQAGVPVKRF